MSYRFNTNQDVLDHVAPFLLQQGRRAMAVFDLYRHGDQLGVKCVLANEDGLACAYGCLVPEEFRHELVNHDHPGVVLRIPGLVGPEVRHYFLKDLMAIHDSVNPRQWRTMLTRLAGQYGLKLWPGGADLPSPIVIEDAPEVVAVEEPGLELELVGA